MSCVCLSLNLQLSPLLLLWVQVGSDGLHTFEKADKTLISYGVIVRQLVNH